MRNRSYHMDRQLFFGSFIVFFLSIMTSSIGMVVDGIVIGNTMDVYSLAAYDLIYPLNFAFAIIGSLLNSGATNMCATALGQNKTDEARSIFAMTCLSGIGFSVIAAVLIGLFANPILALMGAEPGSQIFLLAKGYLLVYIIGLPAITGTKMLSSIMQLDSDPVRAVYSVVVMTVVNITGDLIAVQFFHSNLMAIAAATTISYFAGLAVLLLHFTKENIIFRFVLGGFEWRRLLAIIKRGLPKAVSRVTSTVSGIYIHYVLLMMTSTAVAGFAVYDNIKFVINAVVFGVAQSMMVLVSVYYGEENKKGLMKVWIIALKYQIVFTGAIALILFVFAKYIAIVYLGSNTEAYEFAIAAIKWGALGAVFNGINVLMADYLQATRRVFRANHIYILEDVIFLVAAVSVFSRGGSYERVLAGLFASHALMTLVLPLVVMIVNRRLLESIEDVLMLEEGFGVDPKDELILDIRNMEDVIDASAKATEYFRGKDISARKKYLLALAIEEMGSNIIKHGFTDDKPHFLTIRAFQKADVITLIFRDDCGYFDPVERYTFLRDDNPEANIGIRMIMELAQDVAYASTLKMNNLTIKI